MVYIDDLNIVDTARYSSNRSQVLYEKPVLKNSANFIGLPIFMATVWNFNKKRLRHNFPTTEVLSLENCEVFQNNLSAVTAFKGINT